MTTAMRTASSLVVAPPPVDIPAEALPPRGTLMLGDLHGTREIPAFVGQLVAAASAREPVVLRAREPAWRLVGRRALGRIDVARSLMA
jgi:hypothetical protein